MTNENPRRQLPLEGQVEVARLLVRIQGLSSQEAAQVTGNLKADAEGLSPQERAAVIERMVY